MAIPKEASQPDLPHDFTLLGSLHPAGAPVTIHPPITLGVVVAEFGFRMEADIEIVGGRLVMHCRTNRHPSGRDFSDVYRQATILANSLVDIFCFSQGYGAYVSIDVLQSGDGKISPLRIKNAFLAKLSTSCQTDADCLRILQMATAKPPLLLALNDLVRATVYANDAAINCARAVEGIRKMISPLEEEAKKAWPQMREALNFDGPYLKLITANSTEHRHGNWVPIEPAVIDEILSRSWVVMDRYLHLLASGESSLPAKDFPVLKG